MDSVKRKTQIYLLIFSLVLSLIGVAVFRMSISGNDDVKPMTAEQRLNALEKVAPKSAAMSKFLQNERLNR